MVVIDLEPNYYIRFIRPEFQKDRNDDEEGRREEVISNLSLLVEIWGNQKIEKKLVWISSGLNKLSTFGTFYTHRDFNIFSWVG